MSFPASKVVSTVETELLDPDNVYWTDAELIDWLNKGLKTLASQKPDAFAFIAPFTFVAGSTQTIPDDGFEFLDLVRNLTPVVSAIRQVERNHLDHADPNWPATVGTSVLHFTFDPRFPRNFEIYPQATGATAQIRYARTIADVTADSDSITLDDVYEPCLVYYVLSMAFSKNTKRQDISKASGFMQLFGQFIGQKMPTQMQFAPKTPQENSGQ